LRGKGSYQRAGWAPQPTERERAPPSIIMSLPPAHRQHLPHVHIIQIYVYINLYIYMCIYEFITI